MLSVTQTLISLKFNTIQGSIKGELFVIARTR